MVESDSGGLRLNTKLLQPLTKMANFTVSLFKRYDNGTNTIQTKIPIRVNIRSIHSPSCLVWNSQYLDIASRPPKNSSIQEMAVIWIPIVFFLRLFILDSSDRLVRIVSLHSDLSKLAIKRVGNWLLWSYFI